MAVKMWRCLLKPILLWGFHYCILNLIPRFIIRLESRFPHGPACSFFFRHWEKTQGIVDLLWCLGSMLHPKGMSGAKEVADSDLKKGMAPASKDMFNFLCKEVWSSREEHEYLN